MVLPKKKIWLALLLPMDNNNTVGLKNAKVLSHNHGEISKAYPNLKVYEMNLEASPANASSRNHSNALRWMTIC